LVPVLPTLPVTATMRQLRARARRAPMPSSARSGSSTRSSAPAGAAAAIAAETMARRRPGLERGGDELVAVARVLQATNTSPGARLRVSMEKPAMRERRRAVGVALRRRHQVLPLPQRLRH
jgi:hypothetical protein